SYKTDAGGNIVTFDDGQVFHPNSTAWNIFLGTDSDGVADVQDPNNLGLPDTGHNFQTGDAVIYHSDDPNNLIGGLTNDTTYYVIRVDKWSIQLAQSFADTTTHVAPGTGKRVAGANPIHLNNSGVDPNVHQFLRVNPLGFGSGNGLVDGETYYVETGNNGQTFQLAATPGGTPLNLSTDQTGGLHHFPKAV